MDKNYEVMNKIESNVDEMYSMFKNKDLAYINITLTTFLAGIQCQLKDIKELLENQK